MTAPRSTDQLIKAYLDEGQTELSDRAFDAVRGDIQRTRQRVVFGPWKEPSMSTITRLAIAAAIVLAIGVVWINFAPIGNIGGNPTPQPTSAPSPQLISGANHELEPGRYRLSYAFAPGGEALSGTSILITVPATGWTNFEGFAVDRNYGATSAEAGASFVIWNITNRYVNGCGDLTPLAPAPGPDIDELLEALADQPGIEAGPLTDVTVDGYAGKLVELTVAIDIAPCPDAFYPWIDKFVQGNNEVLRVYALDVDGKRLTFFARIPEMTTPAHLAQLESIIASIDIQP